MTIKILFLIEMILGLYDNSFATEEKKFSRPADFSKCIISNAVVSYNNKVGYGIFFANKQWTSDDDCDLYIDFKTKNPINDSTLHYSYKTYNVIFNPDVQHNNNRAGGFLSGNEKIKVKVGKNNFLSCNNPDLGSFSFDFYIYPVVIGKEHILIRKGTYYDDQFYGLYVAMLDGKIIVRLMNMFSDEKGKSFSRELMGESAIILKAWQHIGIKYDRTSKKISLYINGELDSENLHESEQVSEVLRFHRKDSSDLELFETFRGYVAQFRIMKTAQVDYKNMINALHDQMKVVSPELDLKYPFSFVQSLVFQIGHLSEARVDVMLKKGNTREEMIRSGWETVSLDEKKDILYLRDDVKTRFLQWKLIMTRNQAQENIPFFSSCVLRYEENHPPLPPTAVKAEKTSDETCMVSWEQNYEENVKGYIVYWGEEPKEYENKVDIGFKNSYIISSLLKGKTYYFAVKAYNSREPYNLSRFSSEARIFFK